MKSNINRVSKLGYSNATIAERCHTSIRVIHNHRKKFNALVDKAINTYFFTKSISIPSYSGNFNTSIARSSFMSNFFNVLLLLSRRFITTPIYKGYAHYKYRNPIIQRTTNK